MKKLFFRLLYSGAILTVFVLMILLSIGKAPFDRFVEQQIISAAQDGGIKLSLHGTTMKFIGIRAESGEAFFQRAFMLLPFQNLTVTPVLKELLWGAFGLNSSAQIAQGDVQIKSSINISGEMVINAILNDLQIAELPLTSFLGIQSGKLTSVAEDIHINDGNPASGVLNLAVSGVSRSSSLPIRLTIGGFPFTLDLPEIKDGSLKLKLELSSGILAIRTLESKSSLGTLSVSGDMRLNPQGKKVQDISIKGDVFLSESGHAAFKSFLPLISQGVLKLESRSFSFNVNGAPPFVKSRFFELN